MENKLGDLVKRAKGDDRTIREYARDSGIDAAVISKIITGKYVPQKSRIYRDLTSVQAAPRGGITYEHLLEVADKTISYKAGLMAGAVTSAMLGGIPTTLAQVAVTGAIVATENAAGTIKKKKIVANNSDLEIMEGQIQRFAAMATGIIYGQMARQGIFFRPENIGAEVAGEKNYDTYVSIENQNVSKCVFKYAYMTEKDRKSEYVVKSVGKTIIEKLIFLKPDSNQKISVVVNCSELFDYLSEFKGKLSYRGNLSVILIDLNQVCVTKEEYVSSYTFGEEESGFKII